MHSIDSARKASENTSAVRQLEFSASFTIMLSTTQSIFVSKLKFACQSVRL